MTRRRPPQELSDGDHDEILDNLSADAELAERAIARAVARGLSREEADRLYGLPPSEGS